MSNSRPAGSSSSVDASAPRIDEAIRAPKLAIVALICFFPITVNTLDGLRSVDPEATKMMRTLDASRRQILWRLGMSSVRELRGRSDVLVHHDYRPAGAP